MTNYTQKLPPEKEALLYKERISLQTGYGELGRKYGVTCNEARRIVAKFRKRKAETKTCLK